MHIAGNYFAAGSRRQVVFIHSFLRLASQFSEALLVAALMLTFNCAPDLHRPKQ